MIEPPKRMPDDRMLVSLDLTPPGWQRFSLAERAMAIATALVAPGHVYELRACRDRLVVFVALDGEERVQEVIRHKLRVIDAMGEALEKAMPQIIAIAEAAEKAKLDVIMAEAAEKARR